VVAEQDDRTDGVESEMGVDRRADGLGSDDGHQRTNKQAGETDLPRQGTPLGEPTLARRLLKSAWSALEADLFGGRPRADQEGTGSLIRLRPRPEPDERDRKPASAFVQVEATYTLGP
jgi:hypothetical protein